LNDEIAARLAQSTAQLHGVLAEQAELRTYRLHLSEFTKAVTSAGETRTAAVQEIAHERNTATRRTGADVRAHAASITG